jgi:hypothetical protein
MNSLEVKNNPPTLAFQSATSISLGSNIPETIFSILSVT